MDDTFEKLVQARLDLDRATLERARMAKRIEELEAQVVALQKMVCHVTTGGRGAQL